MNNEMSGSALLRFVGVTAIMVGLAWALQTVAFATPNSPILARLFWTLGAAAICGAGVGLVLVARSVMDPGKASA